MSNLLSTLGLAALLPLSFAACATPVAGEPARMAQDGAPFTMRPGDHVTLADRSTLHFLRLIKDSRCPPDVQCVWAGDAIVAFEWSPAGGSASAIELHTGKEPRSQAIGGRTVTLKSLERGDAPAAELLVESGS